MKDKIIIQKIINYIEDTLEYVGEAIYDDFFKDKKLYQLVPLTFLKLEN